MSLAKKNSFVQPKEGNKEKEHAPTWNRIGTLRTHLHFSRDSPSPVQNRSTPNLSLVGDAGRTFVEQTQKSLLRGEQRKHQLQTSTQSEKGEGERRVGAERSRLVSPRVRSQQGAQLDEVSQRVKGNWNLSCACCSRAWRRAGAQAGARAAAGAQRGKQGDKGPVASSCRAGPGSKTRIVSLPWETSKQRKAMPRRKKEKPLCERFEEFEKKPGECKRCGHSIAEHIAKKREAESQAQIESEDEEDEVERKTGSTVMTTEEPKSCANFTLDTITGRCVNCDEPAEAHNKLRASWRLSFASRLSEVFRRPNKPSRFPCEEFRVDVVQGGYGQCVKCGFNKKEHEKANELREEEEQRLEEERKNLPAPAEEPGWDHPCPKFDLHLTNSDGYGVCRSCGFTRVQHSNFHKNPEEWTAVKNSLTEPKPFK